MADQKTQAELNPELNIEDVQTLLLMGQAIGQEQDEERICTWVCDAAVSLLGARLVSVILTKTNQNSASTICGKLGDSALSASTAGEISTLVEAEDYFLERYGRIGTLPSGRVPTELARQGVSLLARVDLRMIHQMFGVIIVGWGQPVQPWTRK